MAENNILLPKQINVANITFSPVKMLDNGGRMVYINYNGKPFMVQTPEMSTPFGLNRWTNDSKDSNNANDKYSIELSFKNLATKASEMAFFSALRAMDTIVVQAALDNSAAWLKKKYNSVEVVEALYTPCVKFPKDKVTGEITDKYPPTFRISIPFRDNQFACDVYNTDGERMDLGSIETKGGKVSAILTCSSIWVAGGKFGVTWKVVQLRVSPSMVITKFAFKDDEDDNVSTFSNLKIQPAAAAPVSAPPPAAQVKDEEPTEVLPPTGTAPEPSKIDEDVLEDEDEEDAKEGKEADGKDGSGSGTRKAAAAKK